MTICGGGGHLIEGRQIWHIRGGGGGWGLEILLFRLVVAFGGAHDL